MLFYESCAIGANNVGHLQRRPPHFSEDLLKRVSKIGSASCQVLMCKAGCGLSFCHEGPTEAVERWELVGAMLPPPRQRADRRGRPPAPDRARCEANRWM